MNSISRTIKLGIALLTLVVLECGCQQRPAGDRNLKRPSQTLQIACAANLRWAFAELKTEFENSNPDIDLSPSFNASGILATQIQHGAPFDIFLSADAAFPKRLVDSQHASSESYDVYAVGKLVVWHRKGMALNLDRDGLKGLLTDEVRIVAIANPRHAPYGVAAKECLAKAEVWNDLKNRIVYGENASQVAQHVESGSADVGLIPLSLAMTEKLQRQGEWWEVPEDSYHRIEQACVVVTRSPNKIEAERFLDFLSSHRGHQLLQKHGYQLPGATP